jgi:ABC-type transport system involved in cytochrome c biogenesis permease subunit
VETLKAAIPYLSGSAMIFLLCFLWVTALLDIRSRMRNGVYPPGVLVFVAVAISVLTVCLIVAADAVFIDKSSGVLSPWSDWGSRLGS